VVGGLRVGQWKLKKGFEPYDCGDGNVGGGRNPGRRQERPTFNVTRAITIRARPEEIWPWIPQIGYGRAGFCSYDLLDNLGKPSAARIIPELQQVRVGEIGDFPMMRKLMLGIKRRAENLSRESREGEPST